MEQQAETLTRSDEDRLYDEQILQEPDRVVRLLRFGAVVLVVSILSLVAYALLVGVFKPPAPRTIVEASMLQAEAAVRKAPGNGKAWGALAGAQYAAGDTDKAWKTLTQARKRVKDRTILYVNTQEINFLILEGRDAEAVKRVDKYLEAEVKAQLKEKADALAKGVNVPDQIAENTDSVRLIVLKGTAQGNLGKWKDAVTTFDIALQLNDRAADILTLRGWAKLRAGDKKGARKDFEEALKFIPNDASAKQGLAEAKATKPSK